MLKLTDISLVIAKIHETEFADKCPRWRQLCFNGCLYNIIYDSGLQCGSDSSTGSPKIIDIKYMALRAIKMEQIIF